MAVRIGLGALSIAAALFVAAPVAQAATVIAIAPGDGWHEFDVIPDFEPNGGLEWVDFDGGPLSFTFTLTQAALLTVVDAAFGGDAFEVFSNGVSLGVTSPGVNTYPISNTLDFDNSLANPDYSRGIFRLLAGSYTITGVLTTSAIADGEPLNTTVGALKLDLVSETPLPAALPLFVSGLAALGFVARNRKRKAA